MALRRRGFAAIAVRSALVALIAPFPLAARAQRPTTPRLIGVLNDARAANHPTVDGLKRGLRELGFEEGRDVLFDVRLTDANPALMPAAAEALVKARADVIFTSGEAATLAARAATPTTPVVFTLVGDPVAAGFVKSRAAPGGNVTGVSSLATELIPKRLEALTTLAPNVRRVWAIRFGADPAFDAAIAKARERVAQTGLQVVAPAVLTKGELAQVVERIGPGDALLVPDNALMDISALLLEVSLARRVPAVFSAELWVEHGGLASYGADYREQGVQAARLVANILRGSRPQDLPVESARNIVLAVNLKTAASFGLTVPQTVLFRADVIRR
jgi:putative ABC transport system substrate-binding protein